MKTGMCCECCCVCGSHMQIGRLTTCNDASNRKLPSPRIMAVRHSRERLWSPASLAGFWVLRAVGKREWRQKMRPDQVWGNVYTPTVGHSLKKADAGALLSEGFIVNPCCSAWQLMQLCTVMLINDCVVEICGIWRCAKRCFLHLPSLLIVNMKSTFSLWLYSLLPSSCWYLTTKTSSVCFKTVLT